MNQLPYTTFSEIQKSARNRQLVFFGAGNICDKTLRKAHCPPALIADNSPSLWGVMQKKICIEKPETIRGKCEQYFIVICTTSFREVSEQLVTMGYTGGLDFAVSPILNDLRVVDDLQFKETSLLLTSGAPSSSLGLSEGGIYKLEIKSGGYKLEQVLPGSAHGMIRKDGKIYVVEDELGIVELDHDLKVVRNWELPKGGRGHGIAWSEETRCFYVACSFIDQVLELSESFELKRRFDISIKAGREDGPFHHVNDCYCSGGSLYVSMFSLTGNWKKEVFDGGVLEFDLSTGQVVGAPVSNLWMPHNITMINGGLVVLDSLRGAYLGNNMQEIGKFPGFTRGIGYDADFTYIGQSRNRNFSKQMGISNNISIDSGVVIFDERTKVSRTISLPQTVTEIHGVLCLDA